MKDMYSFDVTLEEAYKTYDDVTNAYIDFFRTIQLPVSIAAADSGTIGFPSLSLDHLFINENKYKNKMIR